jgi:hypothetical protein
VNGETLRLDEIDSDALDAKDVFLIIDRIVVKEEEEFTIGYRMRSKLRSLKERHLLFASSRLQTMIRVQQQIRDGRHCFP